MTMREEEKNEGKVEHEKSWGPMDREGYLTNTTPTHKSNTVAPGSSQEVCRVTNWSEGLGENLVKNLNLSSLVYQLQGSSGHHIPLSFNHSTTCKPHKNILITYSRTVQCISQLYNTLQNCRVYSRVTSTAFVMYYNLQVIIWWWWLAYTKNQLHVRQSIANIIFTKVFIAVTASWTGNRQIGL